LVVFRRRRRELPVESRETERQPQFKYDGARRSLEIRLGPDDSATFKTIVVELTEGIAPPTAPP
jgi:hypothetical protein